MEIEFTKPEDQLVVKSGEIYRHRRELYLVQLVDLQGLVDLPSTDATFVLINPATGILSMKGRFGRQEITQILYQSFEHRPEARLRVASSTERIGQGARS